MAQTTKSKIRNQLQSPAFRELATPQASNLVLSTSNMRGVGYPTGFLWFLSCDFLKKKKKKDTWPSIQLSGEQFIFELLPVFAADDPQDSPARSWVYRAKTHSRCRETRSLPRVQTSLLPAPLSGFLAFCRSALPQVKSDKREGQIVQKMLQRRSGLCGKPHKSSFI